MRLNAPVLRLFGHREDLTANSIGDLQKPVEASPLYPYNAYENEEFR